LVTITGGIRTEIAHVRISVRWPTLLSVAGWALLVLAERRLSEDSRVRSFVGAIRRSIERHGGVIAVALVGGTVVVSLSLGAWIAAGADPFGYVSQSLLWVRGNPIQFQTPLAQQAPWPDAAWSFSPLGYRPSPINGLIVPTYAPGLPLQMAAFAHFFGLAGSFVVVPLLAGMAVWATYRFGVYVTRDRSCALLSAVLTACSPVFIFQFMQPLSDVPVTAWWLLSIVAAVDVSARGAVGAGLCASLAVV
jgi:hypothetical protein